MLTWSLNRLYKQYSGTSTTHLRSIRPHTEVNETWCPQFFHTQLRVFMQLEGPVNSFGCLEAFIHSAMSENPARQMHEDQMMPNEKLVMH